jgi:FkbM family methyltransferase
MITIAETLAGKFMVFPNDSLGQCLLEKKDFEPHFAALIRNIIKPGDLCLDVGANLGYHTVQMAKATGPTGSVIAFEPLRVVFQQMCGNCFLNGLRNVHPFNFALGDANGVVQMDAVNYDAGGVNIGMTKVGTGGDHVSIKKLDALGLAKVSFIKLDVQGCEVRFLAGGSQTIAASRPVMFVEVENNWLQCFGCDSGMLLNRILSMGYILLRLNTEYPCDHLAVPIEKESLIPEYTRDLPCSYDIIKGRSVQVSFDRGDQWGHVLYKSYKVLS